MLTSFAQGTAIQTGAEPKGIRTETPASVAAEETTVFLKVLFTDNIFHFLPVRFSDILQLP